MKKTLAILVALCFAMPVFAGTVTAPTTTKKAEVSAPAKKKATKKKKKETKKVAPQTKETTKTNKSA